MKSIAEFDQFYEEKLKSKIDELESTKLAIPARYSYRKYGRNLLWLLSFAVLLIIVSNIFPQIPQWVVFSIPAIILYALVAPIYILVKRNSAFDPIKVEYEGTVIKNIVEFVSKDLTHSAIEGIPISDFHMSGLFDKPDAYLAKDLIIGKINSMPLKISDIHATRRTKIREGSTTSTVTIFTGVFGVAALPVRTHGRTFIYSSLLTNKIIQNSLQSFIGERAADFINEKLKPETIKTGNPEFDKYFYVRFEGEPQQTQINPLLVQTLVTLRREMEIPIYLSLIEDKAYFAFEGIDLFAIEPHVSIEDVSKRYFQYLNLAIGLNDAFAAILKDE